MISTPAHTQHQELGVIRLARNDRAPSLARQAVTSWTGTMHPAWEILILATSELVTNAVKHAAGSNHGGDLDWVQIDLSQGPDVLLLAVTDPGAPCSTPSYIAMQALSLYAERGRGLAIVQKLSSGRWGSHQLPENGHRRVWCHLDLSPTPAQLEEIFGPPV